MNLIFEKRLAYLARYRNAFPLTFPKSDAQAFRCMGVKSFFQ